MRALLLTTLLLFIFHSSNGQLPEIELSSGFDEPIVMETKLFQCANGNTFLFFFTRKNEIEVTVYNKARKVTAKRVLSLKEWGKLLTCYLQGIYEINDEIVMFFTQGVNRKTVRLLRLRINAETGTMIKNEEIGRRQYQRNNSWPYPFTGSSGGVFNIVKDRKSDEYTILCINGYDVKNDPNRVKLIHYNGNHVATDSSDVNLPEMDGIRLSYMDMIVEGGKNTYLSLYANNLGRHDEKKGSQLILCKFTAGTSKTEYIINNIDLDFENVYAKMDYNPTTRQIYLLTTAFLQYKNRVIGTPTYVYSIFLTLYDMANMRLTSIKPISTQKIVERYEQRPKYMESEDSFFGFPMDMIIKPDHTLVIPLARQEEGVTSSEAIPNARTGFGDLGILETDSEGEVITGILIKDPRPIFSMKYEINSIRDRKIGRTGFSPLAGVHNALNYNPFYFDLITTLNANYIIITEATTNSSSSKHNTVCYKMTQGQPIEKFKLFGDLSSLSDSRFSFIGSANYLPSSNTYATVMVENINKKKKAHVAWVEFR